MRLILKNPEEQVLMKISSLVFCFTLLVCVVFVAFTACNHRGAAPPPSSVEASGSAISDETLKALILRLNMRYENVDSRIAQNQEKLAALEEELLSLREAVGVLGPAREPSRVKTAKPRSSDDMSARKPSSVRSSSPNAKSLYDSARAAYSKRDYPTAISRFEEFINAFPSSDLADNAFYWIGESYYAKEDFERAISSFLKLVDRYPQGNKVPDALFKIGLSYSQLSNPEKATEFLTRVMDNYPFSSASKQAKTTLDQLE
jgi:tol-pal system protein YbgF